MTAGISETLEQSWKRQELYNSSLAELHSAIDGACAVLKSRWHNDLRLFASQCFPDHTSVATPEFHALTYLTIQSVIDKRHPWQTSDKSPYVNKPNSPSPNTLEPVPSAPITTLSDVQAARASSQATAVRGGYPPGASKDTSPLPKFSQKNFSAQFRQAFTNLHSKNADSGSEGSRVGSDLSEYGLVKDLVYGADGLIDFGRYPFLSLVEPRGFGKSTKMMVTVLWCLLTGRKKFVVYNSNAHDKAVDLIKPIKYELENNTILRTVYGSQVSDKWAAGEFELSGLKAKVMARGRGQSVRGLKFISHRPDLVILDDIEEDKDVQNRDIRLETQKWLDDQVIKGIAQGNGSIITVGTVLHPDGLIANIATKKERPEKYRKFLPLRWNALNEQGKSIWEEKFTTEELLYEKRLDPYSFAQERMNQPVPLEAGTFKREYFHYFELEGTDIVVRTGGVEQKRIPLGSCFVYLTTDVAITEREYSDYTVLLLTAVSPDNEWFILEYTRERWADPQKTIDELFRLNEKYPVKINGIEAVAAQKWLLVNLQKQMRERDCFLAVQELKADRDKTRRISALQPRFANGAVYLRNNMATLEEELLLFPKSPHDDISDALAYVPQLASVPKKQVTKPSMTGTFQWWRKQALDAKKNIATKNRKERLRHLIPKFGAQSFR